MFMHGTIPYTNERTVNATCSFIGFDLSYNPSAADYGIDTTAIVLDQQIFLILEGNHKQQLLNVANELGLQGCVDYFIQNISQASSFSEHIAVIKGQDLFNLGKIGLQLLGQENVDRMAQAVLELTNNETEVEPEAPGFSG